MSTGGNWRNKHDLRWVVWRVSGIARCAFKSPYLWALWWVLRWSQRRWNRLRSRELHWDERCWWWNITRWSCCQCVAHRRRAPRKHEANGVVWRLEQKGHMVLMVAGARLHVDPKPHLGSIGGFFRGTGGMTPHCWHHQAYRRKDVDRQPKLCRNYVSFGEPSLQAAFRPRKWKRTEKEMKRRWKKQNGTKRIYCFSFPFFSNLFLFQLFQPLILTGDRMKDSNQLQLLQWVTRCFSTSALCRTCSNALSRSLSDIWLQSRGHVVTLTIHLSVY